MKKKQEEEAAEKKRIVESRIPKLEIDGLNQGTWILFTIGISYLYLDKFIYWVNFSRLSFVHCVHHIGLWLLIVLAVPFRPTLNWNCARVAVWLADLEKRVRQLHQLVCRLEEDKYDWEEKLRKQYAEVWE